MSVEQEQDSKPKPRRKRTPIGDRKNGIPAHHHDSLADALPVDRDDAARMIAVAVEDVRSSLDDVHDDVEFALNDIRDRFKCISMLEGSWKEDRANAIAAMERQAAKIDMLIEVFTASLRLTSEADKSTRKRARLMMDVLLKELAKHDKEQSAKHSLTGPQIACLATGGFLAIIGLIATIGWVIG